MKKIKVKQIKKEGHYLKIWVKIPLFSDNRQFISALNSEFEDRNMSYLGTQIDETGKYIILKFILRNKEDIELLKGCKQ